MRYIKFLVLFLILAASCQENITMDSIPGYKLIRAFSNRINVDTGLILSAYGINNALQKGSHVVNGTADFYVSYKLVKTRKDSVSLEEARTLLVNIAESLHKEINSNQEIRPYLDFFPFPTDHIVVSLYFVDENQVGLGSGISDVYFSKGKIEYERYEIEKYTGPNSAMGKHYVVHEESYEDALKKVKEQGVIAYY
ncbi:MAG: hypothetical protein COT85_07900 [Chlamydiae bacterium CG10_big_fil_rev_8_21_14_0_10_42_34]|nr:MAG: hypothetical protein COT85_07900 [Chlamydiae bacterium CG10_big_fil_rev_8_21_14_0_10_42_34]